MSYDTSKQLIELNERLTRQIENNVQILDTLSTDVAHKEREVSDQDLARTHERNQEESTFQTGHASDKMQSMISLTKMTQENSGLAHSQHKKEMSKLRARQSAFNAKIDQIGSQLAHVKNKFKDQAASQANRVSA